MSILRRLSALTSILVAALLQTGALSADGRMSERAALGRVAPGFGDARHAMDVAPNGGVAHAWVGTSSDVVVRVRTLDGVRGARVSLGRVVGDDDSESDHDWIDVRVATDGTTPSGGRASTACIPVGSRQMARSLPCTFADVAALVRPARRISMRTTAR